MSKSWEISYPSFFPLLLDSNLLFLWFIGVLIMNLFFFSLPVFSFEFAAHSNCLPSFYFSFFFVVDSHAMSNQGDCVHLLLPALKVVNLRYRCAEYFTHNFFLHLWIDFLFPFFYKFWFIRVCLFRVFSVQSFLWDALPYSQREEARVATL